MASKTQPVPSDPPPTSSSHFLSARERKAAKRKALAETIPAGPRDPIKVYARKDVRVGDTVRVIGRVDEWMRRKTGGEAEWVRQVIVEEGAGGSVGRLSDLSMVRSDP